MAVKPQGFIGKYVSDIPWKVGTMGEKQTLVTFSLSE